MLGQLLCHISGLFGIGSVVDVQCAGFDAQVARSVRVRRIGGGMRFHWGLPVSGTILPASISTCRAAALRAQRFARQDT